MTPDGRLDRDGAERLERGQRLPRQVGGRPAAAWGAHGSPQRVAALGQRQVVHAAAQLELALGERAGVAQDEHRHGRALGDADVEGPEHGLLGLRHDPEVDLFSRAASALRRAPVISTLRMRTPVSCVDGHRRLLLHRGPVEVHDVACRPVGAHEAVGEPHGPVAHRLDGREVVRHVEQRGAVGHDLADALQALLLEAGVADGQDLVHEQDVGLEEGGDGESQPDGHTRSNRTSPGGRWRRRSRRSPRCRRSAAEISARVSPRMFPYR